jgi:nitroreductase
MELAQAIQRRRMIRSYESTRPVSVDTINRLLELAIRAPSAGFSQGWHFIVLTQDADRERFWTATADGAANPWLDGLRSAPALIIPMSNKSAYLDRYAEPDKGWTDRDESRWPMPYWHLDTAMASMLILLGAVDAELGACFFGIPPDRIMAVHQEFAIPDEWSPIGVISLGYPAPDRRSPSLRRGRRALSTVVSYGRFTDPRESSSAQ